MGSEGIEVLVPEDLLGNGVGEAILVVDDNAANLVALEAALAPLGRDVVTAASGDDALAKLLDQDFALVLLDVQMPGLSGFETATLIRARRRSRSTPILFVTGMSWQDEVVLEGYEVGGFDFIVKPVRPELLRAKARVFLELQERTRELRVAQLRVHEQLLAAQRQRLEAAVLEQRVAQLADLDRRKDEFVAILGHELRNPLQALQMAVELLRQRPSGEGAERVHRTVEQRVQYMSRLVDDLLDVARFAKGSLALERELLAISDVIEQAIGMSRRSLAEKRHQIAVELDRSADPVVFGDRVRLVQVLTNLFDNAIRYTPTGGSIVVTVRTTPSHVVLQVIDSGRGIRPELLPTIFDMFVHDRATTDGHGGLGLGLGLVKRLIDLHEGTVRATSGGPGRGATFEITLPLAPPSTAAVTTVPVPKTRALRLLICDDAEDIRELLGDMLRMHGHEVTVVPDGASAILAIVQQVPDAALIDLGLPDVDGYEVARAARAKLACRCPRLIAVSGFGQERDRERAADAGFDAHLIKPTPLAELLDAIYATVGS